MAFWSYIKHRGIAIILLLIGIFVVSGCIQKDEIRKSPAKPSFVDTEDIKKFQSNVTEKFETDEVPIKFRYETKIVYDNFDIVTLKNDCDKRGGTFNECGLVCDVDPGTCIEMCVRTCENIPAETT